MPARIDRLTGTRIAAILILLVPALRSVTVLAQTAPWPTAAEMERAKQERPFPDWDRIDTQAIPKPPQYTAPTGRIDVEAIARAAANLSNSMAESIPAQPSGQASLRVFVTLAMPEASLRQLVEDASRSGATLVLRGLEDQSMMRTLAKVRALIGDHRVEWQIDPQAFTRFAVRQAPTFVLVLNAVDASCASGESARAESFLSVSGDVSLDYALDAMRRRRPDAAPRIDHLLQRLRGG